MKKLEVLREKMVVLEKGEVDKTMNKHVMRGKIEKFLKTVLDLTQFVQNTQFSRLKWVENKSPKSLDTNFEKFV